MSSRGSEIGDNIDPFLLRAKAYWTHERTTKLTSGKPYPLLPGEAPHLLRVVGLLNRDASMSADAVRKYIQVNQMLMLLEPAFTDLRKRFQIVQVLDCGCGKSYVSFVLAWAFFARWKHQFRILGVDSNPKVIARCEQNAALLGLQHSLRFVAGNLQEFDWESAFTKAFGEQAAPGRPHAVVSLHACDIATDLSLALAIKSKSDLIAVAPCCHAELARKWSDPQIDRESSPFSLYFSTPNLRRDMAACITDGMRVLLVRGAGYEVTATEFVPSEHTPKNRLLICERRGNFLLAAKEAYVKMKENVGGQGILLEELLQ